MRKIGRNSYSKIKSFKKQALRVPAVPLVFLKLVRFDVVSGVEGADFQLFVRVLASALEEM